MSESIKKIVLLLDGEAPSARLLASVLEKETFFIVTDGAANTALTMGVYPSVIIGDLDSLDPLTAAAFSSLKIIAIDDQSSNDFEKALGYLIDNSLTNELVILGLHGKRTDHFLTNLSVLVRFRDHFKNLKVLDTTQEHRLLTTANPSLTIACAIGSSVSILPLPSSNSVRTEGLLYPLSNERLDFGKREGLSNIVSSEEGFQVEISEGSVLVSFPQMHQ